jgi:hypothetical protein
LCATGVHLAAAIEGAAAAVAEALAGPASNRPPEATEAARAALAPTMRKRFIRSSPLRCDEQAIPQSRRGS